MRLYLCYLAAGIGSAVLLAPDALAQTFPADSAWVPITQGGLVIGDPTGDAQGSRDIVGDQTNGAAFVYGDTTYLYFRLRVDGDPKQNADNYQPFGWGVELDTDADPSAYEFLAMLNGIQNPDLVTLEQNTVTATPGSPKDPAEVTLAQYPTSTHARSVQASTNFGGNPDYFVDWAVNLQDLVAAGMDPAKPIRFIFGTSNSAHTLDADLLAPSTATTIAQMESDPVDCSGATCVVCNSATACGDSCSPCSGATPVCDGNQCVQCVDSSQCPTSDPLCDAVTHQCVPGCMSDANCTDAANPACQPDGTCLQCSATNTTLCTGSTPVCNVAAGLCSSSCSTDADCHLASQPACLPTGFCAECSATNTTLCGATEECDTSQGICVNAGGTGGSAGTGGNGGSAGTGGNGGSAGTGGNGGSAGTGGIGGSTGTGGIGGSAGTGGSGGVAGSAGNTAKPPDTVIARGNGVSCSTPAGSSRGAAAALLLLGASVVVSRLRRTR